MVQYEIVLQISIIFFCLHGKQDRAFECPLNSRSYVLLCCHDEEGTEDDEGESETIFDEDEVEVIVLSLC